MPKNKIKSYKEIKKIAQKLKEKNKKLVFANGAFDILHVGHTRYLQGAKKLGDILIVAINSDSSIKNYKNKKPFFTETERAEMLASLKPVDYVFIFNDNDVSKILSEIKPEIHCKGSDYNFNELNAKEKQAVEDYGGKIKLIQTNINTSSSKIREKIAKRSEYY